MTHNWPIVCTLGRRLVVEVDSKQVIQLVKGTCSHVHDFFILIHQTKLMKHAFIVGRKPSSVSMYIKNRQAIASFVSEFVSRSFLIFHKA